MKKNMSKILFSLMVISSTLMTISANSWFGVWMGLEINLLSFIPLIIKNNNNLNYSEAALNYFLVQAFASTIILFSMIMNIMNSNFNFFISFSQINSINLVKPIVLALMLKLGAAPFHFWFPNVSESISWMNCMVLMTWQKLGPMMILSYLINMNNVILVFIMLSTLIGAMGGLNQMSMRKLLAFSSINHIGWMMSSLMFNENLWMIYFLIYSLLNFTIIYLLNMFQIFYLNQMYSFFMTSYLLKFSLLMSMLSLGGLPPLLGFIPKWLIIQSMLFMKLNLMIMFMICMSLITLFYYLKISFSAFMLNYNEFNFILKNFFKNKSFINMTILNFMTSFSFFIVIDLLYIM